MLVPTLQGSRKSVDHGLRIPQFGVSRVYKIAIYLDPTCAPPIFLGRPPSRVAAPHTKSKPPPECKPPMAADLEIFLDCWNKPRGLTLGGGLCS